MTGVDRTNPPAADTERAVGVGVVGVLTFAGHRRRQASCSCGWQGPLRWLLPAVAAVDALTHAGSQGCAPAVPLGARIAPTGPPAIDSEGVW